jgi:hypothetical protein
MRHTDERIQTLIDEASRLRYSRRQIIRSGAGGRGKKRAKQNGRRGARRSVSRAPQSRRSSERPAGHPPLCPPAISKAAN